MFRLKHWTGQPTTPDGPPSPGTKKPAALWPIRLARHTLAQLDGHVGWTILMWWGCAGTLWLFISVMSIYEIATWRTAWQIVYPGLDGLNLLWPLAIMLFGVLLLENEAGWIWSGLSIFVYSMLQLKAAHTDVPFGQLMNVLKADPLEVVAPLWHGILPLFVLCVMTSLLITLLWPMIQAVGQVVATVLIGRDLAVQRRQADMARHQAWLRDHQLKQELTARQHEHERQMALHQFESWSAEEQQEAQLRALEQLHRTQELHQYRTQLLAPPAQVMEEQKREQPRADMSIEELKAWVARSKQQREAQ